MIKKLPIEQEQLLKYLDLGKNLDHKKDKVKHDLEINELQVDIMGEKYLGTFQKTFNIIFQKK